MKVSIGHLCHAGWATKSTSSTSSSQLKDEVCSPAGTSIQANQVLERAGLRGLLMEAVQTACKRAAELSRIENGEMQDYALKRR